jgi:N12 class adenine-specific DNA methylase
MRNFTFKEIDGQIYFKENSALVPINLSVKDKARMRGILSVRDSVRNLIDGQVEGCSDKKLAELQADLNGKYTSFTANFGNLTNRKNASLFSDDDDIHLVMSLEKLDEETKKITKADIFTTRTIRSEADVTSVETPEEALHVSLDIKGAVDIEYIARLCGKEVEETTEKLLGDGRIFYDPVEKNFVEAAEYLSGNIREKLRLAEISAKENPQLNRNTAALQAALPETIPATDISVRLGASWIKTEDYAKFMTEFAGAKMDKARLRRTDDGEYKMEHKKFDFSVNSTSAFGTKRMNMYEIFENLLNQRDCLVKDRHTELDGRETYRINAKESDLAQNKAKAIQDGFVKWLWSDPERRENYVRLYNDKFNNLVTRKYDGSRQTFPGMSPFIKLREHQLNAIARAKYGGNTLLAHEVGAGKSFEMFASVMEKKRLGLINKAAVVVPKALTGQTALEWQRLYPDAKLLVATEKDFSKENRNRFMARLTTGNYDAVICSYEQWEKFRIGILTARR